MNVKIDQEKCKACGDCQEKCSGGAIGVERVDGMSFKDSVKGGLVNLSGYIAVFFPENCIDCMACTEPGFCPSNAVEVEA